MQGATMMPADMSLLIVPYGIETAWTPAGEQRKWLLIVPYGIETPNKMDSRHGL